MHQETPAQGDRLASGWISARHVQHILSRAEAAGLVMDELLTEAGLARNRLADVEYQVPVSAIEHMLDLVSRNGFGKFSFNDDLPLGLHLARDIQPATFGAIGFIAQACASFGDVLDMLPRFNGLLSNIGRTSVIHGPGTVSICWECTAGGPLFRRHASEYVHASFVTLVRLLMPDHENFVSSVHFMHARPSQVATIRQYFSLFKTPVHFDSAMSCLVMPASVLRIPLRHGDAFMKDMLERHALLVLQQREHRPALPDEVMHLIRALMIEGVPDKDAVARQLGISSRSLHRHLQAAGTRYSELLDRVRLSLAQERLSGSPAPLAEVAEQLGFSSRQAFIRWFREQTGSTPGAWRKEIVS